MWNAEEPFNELMPPPSAALETPKVLKAAIEARAALAALNQATRSISNPGILVGTIPLLEAQASSEVENIVTTSDELFRLASGVEGVASPGAVETFRYRQALYAGAEMVKSRPLGSTTAIGVGSKIRGTEVSVRVGSGTHIGNPVTGEVIYTPPVGQQLIWQKLREWEVWVLFMLEAVQKTSQQSLEMVEAIQAVREEFREQMRETSAGVNADLLDLLFEQSYTRIKSVMEACGVSRPTATKWLRGLVDDGLLVERQAGRERLFVNTALLEVLEG